VTAYIPADRDFICETSQLGRSKEDTLDNRQCTLIEEADRAGWLHEIAM